MSMTMDPSVKAPASAPQRGSNQQTAAEAIVDALVREGIKAVFGMTGDTVLPLLDPGHDTVGTHVNVAHLGASPIGMSVTFTAEVIRVDGRRVEFRVEARDEKEKIGEGTHERAIINIARFATRLAEKKG